MKQTKAKHRIKVTGKAIAGILLLYVVVIAVSMVFFHPSDIDDAKTFEATLDDMMVDEGTTVSAVVQKVEDNPVLGTEIWLTEKVVLVGNQNNSIKPGDRIDFKVKGGQENLGVWLVTYTQLGGPK